MNICHLSVKDCDPSNGPPCSEHSDLSAKIFSDAGECCETLLGWVRFEWCVANSENETPSSSGKWFVEYAIGGDPKCVKECDDPEDADCRGLAEEYQELYDSFDECCKFHLWWIPDSPCPVA